jgi:hypothetical protein
MGPEDIVAKISYLLWCLRNGYPIHPHEQYVLDDLVDWWEEYGIE